MKIGILIAAHSNEGQLKRLINILERDFEIFIHIDRKSDIAIEEIPQRDNIHVIKEHEVFWGSINQVRATLSLLELAYKHFCDYYIFISGIDFPIKSNRDIIAEINSSPTTIYMDYQELPRADWNHNGGLDRFQLYYENWESRGKFTLYNLMYALFRKIQKNLNIRRKCLPLKYYGGINWINLSREVVGYILSYLKNHPEYIRKFEYTLCCDEIFFHTLIMNSPFAAKVKNNSKRYIEYIQNGLENPIILRMKDYDKIISSDAWFARKFDENIDKNIIDKILLAFSK